MRPLHLTVTSGASTSATYSSEDVSRISMGRVEGSSRAKLRRDRLALKDSSVSQKHAELQWDGSGWFLVDLGSTNGTKLNGAACTEGARCALKHGDIVQLGPDSKLLVEIEPGKEDTHGWTVEQKLTADSERITASMQALAQDLVAGMRQDWAVKRKELERLLVEPA